MTARLRRQLALILVGVAAAVVALSVATWLLGDACLDAGGRWLAATRSCDAAAVDRAARVRAHAAGVVAGVLAATVLWRTFTFFGSRAGRRRR